MSKQINAGPKPILALLILLCIAAATLATRGYAQTARTGTARNAAIISTTDSVLKETSELRELPILRPVKSGAQSRTEIEQMIIKNLDTDTTPAEIHATETLLRVFGLAPKDFAYKSFLVKLLTEQVAGYYDPKAQQFYLADWIELEGQKPVMAHELTHALQDQHFNLKRFEKWPKGDSDAELAAHALIEGDATLAMSHYLKKNPLVAFAFLRSLRDQQISTEQFKSAPRVLRESLMFPYEQGGAWAEQVHSRGGWDMVSKAYKKLPQSSEQILHPEKYFAYEAPVKLNVPDVSSLLGPKWKLLDTDVNGEWGLYLILDEYINNVAESERASAGWGGDQFSLYEDADSADVFVAQLTAWDTAGDAREFLDAYLKRTWKRYPDAKATLSTITAERGERHEWISLTGRGVIEVRGPRVLVLEGIPATANTNAVLNRIWHQG
jgi:hypothetical protein